MFKEKRKKFLEEERRYVYLFNRYEDAFAISFLTTLLHLVIDFHFEQKNCNEFEDIIDCVMQREDVRNFLKENNLYKKILKLRLEACSDAKKGG